MTNQTKTPPPLCKCGRRLILLRLELLSGDEVRGCAGCGESSEKCCCK